MAYSSHTHTHTHTQNILFSLYTYLLPCESAYWSLETFAQSCSVIKRARAREILFFCLQFQACLLLLLGTLLAPEAPSGWFCRECDRVSLSSRGSQLLWAFCRGHWISAKVEILDIKVLMYLLGRCLMDFIEGLKKGIWLLTISDRSRNSPLWQESSHKNLMMNNKFRVSSTLGNYCPAISFNSGHKLGLWETYTCYCI